MSIEDKIKKAEEIYSDIQMYFDKLEIARIDFELNADLIYPAENQKGTSGIIMLDDGQYYICGSQYTVEQYLNEFKKDLKLNKIIKESSELELKQFRQHYSDSTITDEELEDLVLFILKRVIKLSNNEKVTIAELINYNPEVKNVDSMTQKIIKNMLEKTCTNENIKINLEFDHNDFGELCFYQKFIKN